MRRGLSSDRTLQWHFGKLLSLYTSVFLIIVGWDYFVGWYSTLNGYKWVGVGG